MGDVLPTLGLIQWLFKEPNTSTQAVDKQGTRSGTVFAGRAYDFDGTDDYISHPTVTLSGDFTITINLKLDALTSTRTVSYFNSANSIKVLNTGAIRFEVNNNVITSSTGAILATTAQEIVISRTGSSVDISVDGTSVGSGTESGDFKASLIGYNGTGEYMDGKLFSLQLSSELQYNCEEGDGTTAFDSSGNENHGTITNATLSTFHTTDAGMGYSWLNQVGFTESDGSTYYLNNDNTGLIPSGVLIPRDESNPTKCAAYLSGGTQADLDQVGLVKLNANFVESNCGTLDGANDYAQFNYDLTGLSITSYEGTATPTIDTVNDRITLTAGTFYNLVLSDGNEFPICEGGGTKSECVTDDSKHITWANITEASFWGDTQDTFHYNITKGCSIITHATNPTKYIPYQSDGTPTHYTTAIGETKTEAPAGAWHNDAETKLKMSVVAPSLKDAAFWYSSGTPQARGYSDIVKNYASANVTFADISVTNQKKNLVTYDSAQSGSALSDIEEFLNH